MALVAETPVQDTDSTTIPRSAETPVPDALVWDLTWDAVDQWGAQSFPASDPPANW
jgi:hypothetical protein